MKKEEFYQNLKILLITILLTIGLLMIPTLIYRSELREWQKLAKEQTSIDYGVDNLIQLNGKSTIYPRGGVTFSCQKNGSLRISGIACDGITWVVSEMMLEPGDYCLDGLEKLDYSGKVLLFIKEFDKYGNSIGEQGVPLVSVSDEKSKDFHINEKTFVKISIWVRKDTKVDGVVNPVLYVKE